jgi:ABC-type multidrug transport system fused ATPase/permease subunit
LAIVCGGAPLNWYVRRQRKERCVKFLALVVVWCVLFVLSWPVALAVLVLFPLVWLIALPFRLVGICVGAMLALVKSILFLPARLLGYRG